MNTIRIGEGWDTHALVPGRPLVLGGVVVPHSLGLWGHSDADVLTHAVIDALLGAAGRGDIGRLFPDTDAKWEGAHSLDLLREVVRQLRLAGWEVGNVDSTIIAQSPKLAPFMPAIGQPLANALGVAFDQVNVKAKTAEHLGPVGQQQSIEARAVALIYKPVPTADSA